MKIPKSHPRYISLTTRQKLADGVKKGIAVNVGLIAHGRGEAFDYLLGEKTIKPAELAEKVASAYLLLSENPVISVNGNVASICAKEIVDLSKVTNSKIEVNLFHRSEERVKKIADELRKFGALIVLGEKPDAKINLKHSRGLCTKTGIFSSDVVLVPLEDGDRAKALKDMNKVVMTIDLNPLSRTSNTATVTIVDNIIRAIPNIVKFTRKLKDFEKSELVEIVNSFDNKKNLSKTLKIISERLQLLSTYNSLI